MPGEAERTPVQLAFINFVKSAQTLCVPQTEDRPMEQYLPFRDAVLVLVDNDQFLSDLNLAWGKLASTSNAGPEPGNALVLELQAFPRALEVAEKTGKDDQKKSWWSKMLGRASTTTGSVKDLLDALPPYAKCALTLFKELFDLLKG